MDLTVNEENCPEILERLQEAEVSKRIRFLFLFQLLLFYICKAFIFVLY